MTTETTPDETPVETPAECPSCHTHNGHPHTDYCQAVAPAEYPGQPDHCTHPAPAAAAAGEWLGHRDLCPIQWGGKCDC